MNPTSHLPPHNISVGHPHAPAPSMLYPASDIDWRFNSYMIVYMIECHSPKSSHPLPLPLSPKVSCKELQKSLSQMVLTGVPRILRWSLGHNIESKAALMKTGQMRVVSLQGIFPRAPQNIISTPPVSSNLSKSKQGEGKLNLPLCCLLTTQPHRFDNCPMLIHVQELPMGPSHVSQHSFQDFRILTFFLILHSFWILAEGISEDCTA